MSSGLQILPCLILILLVWNQVPGLQGQEFRFGSCRVEGVVLSELWEAFWTVKNTVQTQDDITSVRLLKPQVLQNVSDAESCYLVHSLLNFYLNTVFKNYHSRIAKFKILKSFSTLANNFIVIVSKLQPSRDSDMASISQSAHQRFLVFRRAFKQVSSLALCLLLSGLFVLTLETNTWGTSDGWIHLPEVIPQVMQLIWRQVYFRQARLEENYCHS
ncbi:interleukin-24 isoform X1 [Meriones unguiculatus]|uniref:interleukin-24 isoform X1 n=1 Tax=Meriones unguiculatus TaxID=10047 RepID=UPI000B4ECB24|nr:interleukin-24 isoform X1 [Meriones unguiculatus]